MKGCVICNTKHSGFFVSSDEFYLCPLHKAILTEENEEESKNYKKNRFVVKGNYAEMSLYNKNLNEKPYKVLVDTEDIHLIGDIRWHENSKGHIVAQVKRSNDILYLRLMDYIAYLRYGIISPNYQPNCNPLDCRKANIRVKKNMRHKKSTIKNIL